LTARPLRFGPGRQPLLRQKKHALRPNKKTSARTAGLVGTEQFQILPTVNINKGYIMKIKDLIKALKKCNQDSKLIFYYLKDNDLISCSYETLLSVDNRVELTIQDLKE